MQSYTAFDLQDACKEPGCPVCRLEHRYVQGYLDNLFHENVNDIELRKKLRLSKGFCPEHGWLATSQYLSSHLGLAIIYKDVINNTIIELKKEIKSSYQYPKKYFGIIPNKSNLLMKRLALALSPKARCPVCQRHDIMMAIIISSIIEKESVQAMMVALKESYGLCFPHLKRVLGMTKDTDICIKLIKIHLEKLTTIREDLSELIRKKDYRFAGEGVGKEAGAWLRALEIVNGRRINTK
jgi:hypothetical protein